MNTIYDDLMERSVDIHRTTGFDSENADLFAHNTIVIAASAERVWAKPHCAMCGQRAAALAGPRKQAHTRALPVPMHGHNPGLDPGVLRGRHAPIGATVTA